MANVIIDGSTLVPQPANINWQATVIKGKVNGTEAVGSAYIVTLTAPNSRGGTANWNWSSFENQVLTSIVIPARGQTLQNASFTTYNTKVVGKAIRQVRSVPGNILTPAQFDVLVVT